VRLVSEREMRALLRNQRPLLPPAVEEETEQLPQLSPATEAGVGGEVESLDGPPINTTCGSGVEKNIDGGRENIETSLDTPGHENEIPMDAPLNQPENQENDLPMDPLNQPENQGGLWTQKPIDRMNCNECKKEMPLKSVVGHNRTKHNINGVPGKQLSKPTMIFVPDREMEVAGDPVEQSVPRYTVHTNETSPLRLRMRRTDDGDVEHRVGPEQAMDTTAEEVYVVILPRWQHRDQKCMQAKMEELEKFEKYDAYEVVDRPSGKKTIGSAWIGTKKSDGKIKFRLCMRGDQEEDVELIQTDSPTVCKLNIRLVLVAGAREPRWTIEANDVQSAFLQTQAIEREVYVHAPPEAGLPRGKVWKLKKTVYGLLDASRGFFLNYAKTLVNLGMESCRMDPAFFFHHSDGSTKDDYERSMDGILCTHVDDSLTAGPASFKKKVIKPVMEQFVHGPSEKIPMRFVGMNLERDGEGLSMNQDHYVAELESPKIDDFTHIRMEDKLDEDGQTTYRSVVAKLTMLSVTSRPDIAFETKLMSRQYNKATKKDLKDAIKKLKYVKEGSTKMCYPDLGKIEDWMLVGFADASNNSLPDKIGSIGGQVLLLVNKKTERACVLGWRSKQLARVVHSSLAAEGMAVLGVLGDLRYIKTVLAQMYGTCMKDLPTVAVTDSKNLWLTVHQLKQPEDKHFVHTLAEIKESMALDSSAHELRHLPKQFMLADGLTKRNGKNQVLMDVLQSGRFRLEGGWEINYRSAIFVRTWIDLNNPVSGEGQEEEDRNKIE